MNTNTSSHAYDPFEQVLLGAAKLDRAPSDLPARLGVALGLGIPVLVAADVATALPATTSLASAGVSHLATGTSTLVMAALKAIAIGFVSGTAVLGTGHVVAKSFNLGGTQSAAAQQRSSQAQPAKPTAAHVDLNRVPPPSAPERQVDELAPAVAEPVRQVVAVAAPATRVPTATLGAADAIAPQSAPAVAETPAAVAQFPGDNDGESVASGQNEDSKAVLPLPPPVKPLPEIEPEALNALRARTLQRCRTLLGQSRAALALAELESFRARVGDRHFGMEELLLRVESLAVLGRAKEAQATVARIERIAPNSVALRQAQILARSRFVR